MISRKSTLAISDAYLNEFSHSSSSSYGNSTEKLDKDHFYDYLYEHEYEAWFCNACRQPNSIRQFKEWILRIHTGETLSSATPDWPWDKRQLLGQQYLKSLSKDILNSLAQKTTAKEQHPFFQTITEQKMKKFDTLVRRLEIDGYIFKDHQLYESEVDILNVEEELSLLERLHSNLELHDREQTFTFLKLSEEHYISGKWSDCISNSRKFFEAILQQVASRVALHKNISLKQNTLNRPFEVRKFLETNELIEKKERETVDKVYGLLSQTGSHPYMAEKDQSRLLRQISLTITQFIMLRLEGYLQK